ncbi:hypothetical protein [Lysobacter humi (ex Lee et al. 2017)]
MDAPRNRPLLLGAALSTAAALVHVGIIFGGPAWYRFFGAASASRSSMQRAAVCPTS